MQSSEHVNELAKALASAQAQIEGARKDSKNAHLGNKYADLSSVWDACRTALTSNGLSVAQGAATSADGSTLQLDTRLMHESGQWIESRMTMRIATGKGVNDAQAYGLTMTYARRYALAAMVGVVQEDSDANMHHETAPARPAHTPPPAAKPATEAPSIDGVLALFKTLQDEHGWTKEQKAGFASTIGIPGIPSQWTPAHVTALTAALKQKIADLCAAAPSADGNIEPIADEPAN